MQIKKVGVIGAGQMGNGIAHVCALADYDVGLYDVSKERIEAFAGGAAGVIEDFRLLSLHCDAKRIKPRKAMQAAYKRHKAKLADIEAGKYRAVQPAPAAIEQE